jgi:hypothetical protein
LILLGNFKQALKLDQTPLSFIGLEQDHALKHDFGLREHLEMSSFGPKSSREAFLLLARLEMEEK